MAVLKTKDYILVGLQGLIFILYLFDLPFLQLKFPSVITNIGLGISIFGGLIVIISLLQLNKNLSPFPSPKKGSKLVQNGLYKYVRHPIYSGILIAFGGFSVFSLSGYRVLLSLLLYVLFIIKVRYEEKQLLEQFEAYERYRSKTGAFLPKLF